MSGAAERGTSSKNAMEAGASEKIGKNVTQKN